VKNRVEFILLVEEKVDKLSDEDRKAIEAAWDEDFYDGMESLGWSNDDTEYHFHGPLRLENEDTGEVFEGEPEA
jgi:hypothetical protein